MERLIGVEAGWTPHSPRAGYATDAIARDVPFSEVKETGRWFSDSSLRVYIDVIGASGISRQLVEAGRESALIYALKHLAKFFTGAHFTVTGYDGASQIPQSSGRPLLPYPPSDLLLGPQRPSRSANPGQSARLFVRGR